MGKESKIFLAATRQNDGKTMTCIGLVGHFNRICRSMGFIKPVGQRYVRVEGQKVDEDAVLVNSMIDCRPASLRDMSPVAIDRGYTERYLDGGNVNSIIYDIRQAYERVSEGKDMVVIEGTGHAGVGSIIDLNNAQVAKLLDAKVIIISLGGIGRPIDEITLNQGLFEKEGVEIVGAIVNKVVPEKKEKIEKYLRKGLAKKGIDLLGAIPYDSVLTSTNMEQIHEALGVEFLSGRDFARTCVRDIVVGAMFPHNALKYMARDSLLVTPGDREDLILAAMSASLAGGGQGPCVGGMILTGGLTPDDKILEIMRCSRIPVLLSGENTYMVASKLHDLVVKIRAGDDDKINTARELIAEHVDVNRIFEKL